MKEMVKTLALILIILSLVMAGPSVVNVAEANFKPYGPPYITIFSPSPNQVYNSSKIILDVSVMLSDMYPPFNNITSLNCSLDGQQDISIPIGRSISGLVLHEKSTLSNLSNGIHSVLIHGESTPFDTTSGYPVCSEKIPFNATVSFTVKLPSTFVSEPFPILPVATASLGSIAVGVSLLIYLKKHRGKTKLGE